MIHRRDPRGDYSPDVILDDADLVTAVADGASAAYMNSGQTCSALTRMIVPRSRLSEVEGIARVAASPTPSVTPSQKARDWDH